MWASPTRVASGRRKRPRDHKIPKVYDSLEELVSDPEVEIVDIAVYPWETLKIGEQAVRAGKHILCQKPLSDEYGKAANLVAMARDAGLKMAVNQQMRWTVAIHGSQATAEPGMARHPNLRHHSGSLPYGLVHVAVDVRPQAPGSAEPQHPLY